MPKTTRSKNVDLIRWLNNGHENTVKRLKYVTNSTYLSKMALGDMDVGDRKARSIERSLGMPVGWLDRDNVAALNMSADEFELLQRLSSLQPEARTALLQFLSSVTQ